MTGIPRALLSILAVLALVAVSLVASQGSVSALTTFVVNSTDDVDDGACNVTHCSLREAIDAANASAGTDNIAFDIPGVGPHTVQPGSALPAITDPVVLDGTSQPGYAGTPIVELDGTNAGVNVTGVFLTAGNSTVRGLVINRFGGGGIFLETAGGNLIEGNYIGTDLTGTVAVGNENNGIYINDVPSNTIGGTTAAARNVISGNDGVGVSISGAGATGNRVQGNYLGTDASGTADLGNAIHGVSVQNAADNTIGGTAVGAGNIISGNDSSGLTFEGSGATGNVAKGNYIGTDVTGTVALGNVFHGVHISNAPSNIVGGTTAAARNIISGSGAGGVSLQDSGTTGNVVLGNYIGTDVTGTAGLGNASVGGVSINDAPSNTIGGTTVGARNVISGNDGPGIKIEGSGATGNLVQGNFIGTDVTGTDALANTTSDGVFIKNAPGNTVGGTAPGAGNVLSGNGDNGVEIFGADATGNLVQGNYIGTDVSGTVALGNALNGVYVENASSNTLGGTAPGAGNTIASNSVNGVSVFAGVGNAVLSNSIFSNDGLGINLGSDGVTPNDVGDADTGANNLQNFPVLTSAGGGSTTTEGTLDSTPNTSFRLEFFSSGVCDTSGYGEGETFLGFTEVTTDGGGDTSFSVVLANVAEGDLITVTATDANNNTSEFSRCDAVRPAPPPPPIPIPGLTPWGLVGMAGLMAAALMWRLRRTVPGARED